MTQTRVEVPYIYLTKQFSSPRFSGSLAGKILLEIEEELSYGRFTLGPQVQRFEEAWAEATGAKYAVGVGNGTDAIKLSLRTVGIVGGDRVVTSPTSFVATVGAILELGAIPVFGDIDDSFTLPVGSIYPLLSSDAKAVVPVFWGGWTGLAIKSTDEPPPDRARTIPIISDACQAVGAHNVGSIGKLAAFSLHPLKNVNIWGDGGVITTNDEAAYKELLLLRNHGLSDRDTCMTPGYNTRLDTIQAIVGLHVLQDLAWVTERRIANANRYDTGLADIAQIKIPPRDPNIRHVYHLYQFEIPSSSDEMETINHDGHIVRVPINSLRDVFVEYLNVRGIEAKVHYPTPLHLMPGFDFLGYKRGDFPRAEQFADTHVSLPIHQYLTEEQIDYTIEAIRDYFASSRDVEAAG